MKLPGQRYEYEWPARRHRDYRVVSRIRNNGPCSEVCACLRYGIRSRSGDFARFLPNVASRFLHFAKAPRTDSFRRSNDEESDVVVTSDEVVGCSEARPYLVLRQPVWRSFRSGGLWHSQAMYTTLSTLSRPARYPQSSSARWDYTVLSLSQTLEVLSSRR